MNYTKNQIILLVTLAGFGLVASTFWYVISGLSYMTIGFAVCSLGIFAGLIIKRNRD